MMRMLTVGALLLAAGLGACAPPQPRPAFVAYGDSGSFGYTDSRLAEDAYQIAYVTPYVRTATDPAGREAELAEQKEKAYDLALWRAAQIADRDGYPYFLVEEQSRDAVVTVRVEPAVPYSYDPNWHYYGNGPFYRPSPFYPYQFGYNRYDTSAVATITAQLRVKLLKESAPASLDSRTTATQLAARYGSTTYPATTY